MKWLLDYVDDRIASPDFAAGMFARLEATSSREDLGWIHQLAHMSRGFIQALLARVARCGRSRPSDYLFYRAFTRHARLEMRHPMELEDWATSFGLVGGVGLPDFCGVSPTMETAQIVDLCREVADDSPPDEQVVAMNVVAEGVAYRFFAAAKRAILLLGMAGGSFWRDHDDDLEHARIGVTEVGEVDPDSDQGRHLLSVARLFLDRFHLALESWSRVESISVVTSAASDRSPDDLVQVARSLV